MKRWIKAAIKYGLFIVVLLALFFTVRKLDLLIFGVRSCVCKIDDDHIASHVQKEVELFLCKHKTDKPETLLALAQDYFPFFKKIEAIYSPPNSVNFFMHAYRPRIRVNNEFALIPTGQLIAKNCFVDQFFNSLTPIFLVSDLIEDGKIPIDCVCLLQQIDLKRLNQYELFLKSEHEIALRDKFQKRFIIVSDRETILDYTLLQRCEDLKKKLVARKKFQSQRADWIADIRFEKQIIVRADRGSNGYYFS